MKVLESLSARLRTSPLLILFMGTLIGSTLLCSHLRAAPVEFTFSVPPSTSEPNPFARDIWARVRLPSGLVESRPAFHVGADHWAVRLAPRQAGRYQLLSASEASRSGELQLRLAPVGSASVSITKSAATSVGPVRIDPRDPRRFAQPDGPPYYPIGLNYAWDHKHAGTASFPDAFAEFEKNDLNWVRVWMCHWGATNLDWPADRKTTPAPAPGYLDLATASRWDRIINLAEQHNLYLQIVLQHHGQLVSGGGHGNWAENPWNKANGGFLDYPSQFFTHPLALEATRIKYRYIVARWGYSDHVFAWELFNEFMWVNTWGLADSSATIAAWHTDMARQLRRYDIDRHLVTTSHDDILHPAYAAMDFYQPHLYVRDSNTNVRRFDLDPATSDRPMFYGEIGHDHFDFIPKEQRQDGHLDVPQIWPSLFGDNFQPAQLWYSYNLIPSGRFGELGALARFAHAAQLDRRADLQPFSPPVRSDQTIPHTVLPAIAWTHRAPAVVPIPLDGSEPPTLASVPRNFVTDEYPKNTLPGRVTFAFNLPAPLSARLEIDNIQPGAALRLQLDDRVIVERSWPRLPDAPKAAPQAPGPDGVIPPSPPAPPAPAYLTSSRLPEIYPVVLPAGQSQLTLSNPGGTDRFQFVGLHLDREIPLLAACGRRAPDLVALWVWHRTGLWQTENPNPATATILIPDLPAGHWRIEWWDSFAGIPAPATVIDHPGGTLELPTPPVARHAAVILTRR
jgi:hypothetical protein